MTRRSTEEMWAEAMEHARHSRSSKCPVCHGDPLWKPADLEAYLDGNPQIVWDALAAVQAEVAAKSPWCGTCNPRSGR